MSKFAAQNTKGMFFFGMFSSIAPYLGTLIIMCIYMVAGIPKTNQQDNLEFSTETTKIITLHESASIEKTLSSETFFSSYFYSFELENKEHITPYPSIVSRFIISKKQVYNNSLLTSKNGINAPPIA